MQPFNEGQVAAAKALPSAVETDSTARSSCCGLCKALSCTCARTASEGSPKSSYREPTMAQMVAAKWIMRYGAAPWGTQPSIRVPMRPW